MKKIQWGRWKITGLPGIAMFVLMLAACKKENTEPVEQTPIEKYSTYLPATTIQELTAAKNATQKYQSLDSAIADGYADINVITQNMGFHYMKASLADTLFQPEKPEILVYNKQHDGHVQLVAVEYAVPIPLMPNKEPQGFYRRRRCMDLQHHLQSLAPACVDMGVQSLWRVHTHQSKRSSSLII